uniref:Transcription initiation factor IIA subunit 1-like n=1 Tax=Steinernema glaseri TaxID=37863 RepID=A0A1I7ZH10_9BILA
MGYFREEEPLNSEDDLSDDEDLETVFDADNVAMCQFEKVDRVKRKWKFHLKHGVMKIEGRDYVFSKCFGETEF